MYVCMSLFDRVLSDHDCGGMIAYVGEWHEEVPGYEESIGKSSPNKSIRSVSCGYDLILCDYVMDRLYRAMHQRVESSVVCGMLG